MLYGWRSENSAKRLGSVFAKTGSFAGSPRSSSASQLFQDGPSSSVYSGRSWSAGASDSASTAQSISRNLGEVCRLSTELRKKKANGLCFRCGYK